MSDRDRCINCIYCHKLPTPSYYCNCPVPNWVDTPNQVVDAHVLRDCACYTETIEVLNKREEN